MNINGKKTAQDWANSGERWDWLLSSLVLDDMFVHEMLMIMDKKSDLQSGYDGCLH